MNTKIRIAIDAKNLALYSGGIAQWFAPLLQAWAQSSVDTHQQYEFFIIAPAGQGLKSVDFTGLTNTKFISPSWPTFLIRQLRHVLYDNWIFPRIIAQLKPQCIVSPYHDVLLPKKSKGIFSIMTIHDLCFLEVPRAYPWSIRTYYLWMLRRNLARANHILTISQTTQRQLVDLFQIPEKCISVIPNTLAPEFLEVKLTADRAVAWKEQYLLPTHQAVLYASGVGHRKNIERMLAAMRLLWSQGSQIQLWITGEVDSRWRHLFLEAELATRKIIFLGFLSLSDLRLAYESADAVIYPSLCEGFGRSCLEAMVCGTPLACSNIAVFREVTASYPQYFDPLNVNSIATAIRLTLQQKRQQPIRDARYQESIVKTDFIETMDRLVNESQS